MTPGKWGVHLERPWRAWSTTSWFCDRKRRPGHEKENLSPTSPRKRPDAAGFWERRWDFLLPGTKAQQGAESLWERFWRVLKGCFLAPQEELALVVGEEAARYLYLTMDLARAYLENSASDLKRVYDTQVGRGSVSVPSSWGASTEAVGLMLLDGRGPPVVQRHPGRGLHQLGAHLYPPAVAAVHLLRRPKRDAGPQPSQRERSGLPGMTSLSHPPGGDGPGERGRHLERQQSSLPGKTPSPLPRAAGWPR